MKQSIRRQKSLSKANSEETHRGTVCLQNVETATEDIASIRLKHVCIDPAVDCEIDAQSLNPWRRRKMRRLHGAIRQRMVSVAAQAAPALSKCDARAVLNGSSFWCSRFFLRAQQLVTCESRTGPDKTLVAVSDKPSTNRNSFLSHGENFFERTGSRWRQRRSDWCDRRRAATSASDVWRA